MGRPPGTVRRTGCIEVYSNWKHWYCLFPQHGGGPKHLRSIEFERWQTEIIESFGEELLKGLIHSDGWRGLNPIRRRFRDGWRWYSYPRYLFVNYSPEIRALFSDTCQRLGIDCRPSARYVLSVARRESVSRLDAFVGPKM